LNNLFNNVSESHDFSIELKLAIVYNVYGFKLIASIYIYLSTSSPRAEAALVAIIAIIYQYFVTVLVVGVVLCSIYIRLLDLWQIAYRVERCSEEAV
jgi:hypothetical protein